jgi:hypothetical protein
MGLGGWPSKEVAPPRLRGYSCVVRLPTILLLMKNFSGIFFSIFFGFAKVLETTKYGKGFSASEKSNTNEAVFVGKSRKS